MAAEVFLGAFTGAIVSAVVDEVIALIKGVYRCKDVCDDLAETLESIKPLVAKADGSSYAKNAEVRAWLTSLHSLLLKAKDLVGNCVVKRSRFSFHYLRRALVSSKIKGIHDKIKGKLSSEGALIILIAVGEIDCKLDGLLHASGLIGQSPSFEVQQVPSHIAAFDNNPFKKLKELIVSMPSSAYSIIGVKGKGGAGKTLLAKMVNNDGDIQKIYGPGSILWTTIGQDVSVSSVYKQMGKFLNNGGVFERDYSGRDLEAQRTYLMGAFQQKRALVILDDVWGNCVENHAMIYWLDVCKGEGSITLITTRDRKVLDRARAMERIELNSLSKEESWALFSYHAFQPNMSPSSEVEEIAKEICGECKGLPLALEVIGGALWNEKDVSGWKYALGQLKGSERWTNSSTLEDELFHRLRFSYDVLSVEAKKCFLYFAAFPEDYRIQTKELCSIWQVEELFGPRDAEDALNIGRMQLITLADRSLIDLDDDGGHAKVHDVMRDLAVRIIRNAEPSEWAFECQFEPGKVLKTLPKIKNTTKRVSFVGAHVKNYDPQAFLEGYNIRICLLSSITWDNGSTFLASCLGDLCSRMTHVHYLTLRDVELLEELPEGIKELKSFLHLDLRRCSSLEELPEGIKELKSLTHLDLTGCSSLKELPEGINELKSLTHLELRWCSSLEELPDGIKELKSLTHLDLEYCWSLKELPEGIKELKSLMHLDLGYCSSLKKLPEGIKELKSLTHLYLTKCSSLEELPKGIKELKSLTHLILRECSSLKKLPEGIKELKSLACLDLFWCLSLKELPEGIKELKSLTHLNLMRCSSLKKLPEGIKELKSLTHLDLEYCSSLEELPEGIKELKSLTRLNLNACSSLKQLPEGIKELKSLMHLDLCYCLSLEELPEGTKELKSLMRLDLRACSSLKELPEGIKELKSLTHLVLRACSSLKELPEGIKELKSLMRLDLRACSSLKELPEGIKELKSLTHLVLRACSSLKELPEGIKELKSLLHLDLRRCSSLEELPEGIKELKSLTHLDLMGCSSLKELPEGINELKSLTHLELRWCSSLEELPKGIKELKSLTHLELTGCSSLKELPEGIKELKSLTHLDLRDCSSLEELPEGIKEALNNCVIFL